MNIVNCTPHTLHLPTGDLEPSGILPRCKEWDHSEGEVNGIPLITRHYGAVYDLPDPQPDTLYIVSLVVRQALPKRTDLASPGTLVRDAQGNITGCTNLVVNHPHTTRHLHVPNHLIPRAPFAHG